MGLDNMNMIEPYSDEWQGMKSAKVTKTKRQSTNEKMKRICPKCKKLAHLTDDHIVPLAMLRAMGISCNNTFNIQRICRSCNQIKGSQLDPHNKRTLPVLKHYIKRWSDLYQIKTPRRKYVFRTIDVKSLSPDTYYFCESKKALQSIYERQKRSVL